MRLIDVSEYLLKGAEIYWIEYDYHTMYEHRKPLYEIPTVDTAPVVHGKWIMTNGMKPPEYHHHHQCSVCGSYAPMRPPYGSREELSPWCPACGAKMDLEEQHD